MEVILVFKNRKYWFLIIIVAVGYGFISGNIFSSWKSFLEYLFGLILAGLFLTTLFSHSKTEDTIRQLKYNLANEKYYDKKVKVRFPDGFIRIFKVTSYIEKDNVGIVEGIIIDSNSSDYTNGEKAWAYVKDVEVLD